MHVNKGLQEVFCLYLQHVHYSTLDHTGNIISNILFNFFDIF